MKIKSLRLFVSVIIFGGISPVVFSSAIQSNSESTLKKSNSSSSIRSELHEIPVITNEAENAEFQKQRELAGRASSSSAKPNNGSAKSKSSVR